jgi:hypothetical protein
MCILHGKLLPPPCAEFKSVRHVIVRDPEAFGQAVDQLSTRS